MALERGRGSKIMAKKKTDEDETVSPAAPEVVKAVAVGQAFAENSVRYEKGDVLELTAERFRALGDLVALAPDTEEATPAE